MFFARTFWPPRQHRNTIKAARDLFAGPFKSDAHENVIGALALAITGRRE
jgi:hypothetical protein